METTTYAVISTGGKQYRVAPGQKIRVEKLTQNAGDDIRFDVLFVKDGDKVLTGKPTVAGAKVTGKVLRQFKGKKLIVYKKRSKKGYAKLNGHRQNITEVEITSVAAA
jgi:large subunit ribosomal protein L21